MPPRVPNRFVLIASSAEISERWNQPQISHSLCGLTKRRAHAESLLQMTRERFRLGQPVRRDHSPVGERSGRVP